MPAPQKATLASILSRFRPGNTVYVQGLSGESVSFYKALQENPQAAMGVRFVGVHFPGVNRSDYIGLHPSAQQRAYFMLPGLRGAFSSGRAELLPLDYPGIFTDMAEHLSIDIAVVQVAPPDAHGICSLGPCVDFLPAVWRKAALRIGHINPRLPGTRSSFTIRESDFSAVYEDDAELLTYDVGAPTASMSRHAALIANLVHDGDTIECGIGKLPAAVLSALSAHRGLRIHSGMVMSQAGTLIDSGAIRGDGAIQVGVALGDDSWYRRVGADDTFYFRPVNETHDIRRIADICNFCAINSAVEVDLFGQVNADSIRGRLVAGVGGLPTFTSAAHLSTGGRSIIALPATTDDDAHSRIVSVLAPGSSVAVPRHQADYIVTEYGVAALRHLPLQARARALIAIAAPQFREHLERAWHDIACKF